MVHRDPPLVLLAPAVFSLLLAAVASQTILPVLDETFYRCCVENNLINAVGVGSGDESRLARNLCNYTNIFHALSQGGWPTEEMANASDFGTYLQCFGEDRDWSHHCKRLPEMMDERGCYKLCNLASPVNVKTWLKRLEQCNTQELVESIYSHLWGRYLLKASIVNFTNVIATPNNSTSTIVHTAGKDFVEFEEAPESVLESAGTIPANGLSPTSTTALDFDPAKDRAFYECCRWMGFCELVSRVNCNYTNLAVDTTGFAIALDQARSFKAHGSNALSYYFGCFGRYRNVTKCCEGVGPKCQQACDFSADRYFSEPELWAYAVGEGCSSAEKIRLLKCASEEAAYVSTDFEPPVKFFSQNTAPPGTEFFNNAGGLPSPSSYYALCGSLFLMLIARAVAQ